MFYWMPYSRQILHTQLSLQETSAALKEVIIPRPHWWESSDAVSGNFEGVVLPEEFKMQHVLIYRNSFNPVVYGQLSAMFNGTRIVIKMVLNPFVAAFCFCWFSSMVAVLVLIVYNCAASNRWTWGILIPVGMLLAGYSIVSIGFTIEANKAIGFLNEMFNAKKQTVY